MVRTPKTHQEGRRALRLPEVLGEEEEYLAGKDPSTSEASSAGMVTDADLETFDLVNAGELLAKLRRRLPESAKRSTAPEPSGKGATEGSDVRYARLAEWCRSTSAHALTLDGRQTPTSPDQSPTTAPEGDASPAETVAPMTEERVVVALQDMLRRDLPIEAPWLRDVPLRPYTRGLLEQHLASGQRRVPLRRASATPNPLLNRLLLEDAFAEHIERLDDRLLREHFARVHQRRRAALCLSGGGIRSATFALGLLQGLARHGVLDRFHYLSTVSGGGYAGGWLSAWIRHAGLGEVTARLRDDPRTPLTPEPEPVRHLREYSNYLSPRVGLLSADWWTLVAIFVRNLLLLWLVLVPLLAAVVAIPWITASVSALPSSPANQAIPEWRPRLIYTLGLIAALLAAMAVRFVHAYRPESKAVAKDPAAPVAPAADRSQGAFLVFCLLPLSLAVVCWTTAVQWFACWHLPLGRLLTELKNSSLACQAPTWSWKVAGLFAAGGALIHLVGWLAALPTRHQRREGWRRGSEWLAILGTGAAAGILLLGATMALRLGDSGQHAALYAWVAFPATLLVILLAGFVFEGITSNATEDPEREWTARYSAWILIVAGAWLTGAGIVLFGPRGVIALNSVAKQAVATAGGIGSMLLTVLLGRSAKTAAIMDRVRSANGSATRGAAATIARRVLPIVAAAAIVSLVIGLSFLDMGAMRLACAASWPSWLPRASWLSWLHCGRTRDLALGAIAALPPHVPLFTLLLLAAIGGLFARLVDTNRFSLHAMYRARLIRAYLGASRPRGERRPNPFTGFDEADNLPMGCVTPLESPDQPASSSTSTSTSTSASASAPAPRPLLHIVNVALNLVAGRNLAWQERRADTFTVSPLHAGAMRLGYRRTRLDGGAGCPTPPKNKRFYGGDRGGITLGTAMTISGAAASPNMGYHSSPTITFLMTLFNARLGWWLGNPGPAGDQTFNRSSPRLSVLSTISELLGLTDDTHAYVYLSDGGHFENLGLYEMVLRRNRLIVVSDASCDEACALQDLGNAIRKIRIDLGIPIEFDESQFKIRARSSDPAMSPGRYWALAKIRYSCVDRRDDSRPDSDFDGLLLYVKAGFYGHEPRDVQNYATDHRAFPHESTADQFFTESQFESYRALGSHVVNRMQCELGVPLLQLFSANWQTEQLIGIGARSCGSVGRVAPAMNHRLPQPGAHNDVVR